MNHIYRTVFNEQTQTCQAVSENTKTHASCGGVDSTPKNQKNQRVVHSSYFAVHSCFAPKLRLISALIMAFSGSLLCAAPQGGQVRAGQAQITQQGKVTNINQSSQKAAINWQKFNIAADETVNFKQPNAHSVTLNRVIGNEKSVINGAMNANGKVFLLNPHGTLIGKGAKINVGGLVASTANISDDDFMQGKYRFTGNGSGAVENYGEIAVPAGGVVALIAPIVKNNGNIKADSASVLLASAEHFSITLPENGDFAYTIDKGTLQGLVDNGGAVLADGGVVVLTAAGLDSVKKSVVRHTGIIQANTVANKNGKILLLGDLDNSRTEVSGVLSAEAPISGDGGFIETSANQVQIDDSAFVSTKATNGKIGEWLIDPTDYTVAASGGDMTGAAVSNALQNNNLTLKSTNGKANGRGDVVINDTINWNKNTLTLNAQNDIHINKTINGSGSAKLALQYGQASADGGKSNYYLDKDVRVNLPTGQNLSTQKGSSGEKVNFEVIHQMPEITHITDINDEIAWSVGWFDKSSNIAIGKDIDLSNTKNYSEFDGYAWSRSREQLKLDGLGHQLSHLTINNNNEYSKGFIAWKYDNQELELSNIHLRNVDISAGNDISSVGGLLGYGGYEGYGKNGNIKIRNSSVDGKISGSPGVGGLVGYAENISISDSFTKGEIKAEFAWGGGIAGNLRNATINNSYSSANVVGEGVGGLVGVLKNSNVTNSYATGNVQGDRSGGLIGLADNADISSSYATGNVLSEYGVAGGLIGSADDSKISKSYATGKITAGKNLDIGAWQHGTFVGGLVGSTGNTNISRSYATGEIDTANILGVGGLVGGATTGNTHITQSYSTSNITGEQQVGGLVGVSHGATIENSYATGTLTHKDSGGSYGTNPDGRKLVYFGGLVGGVAEPTTIRNSYFSGSLNIDDEYTGRGIVGGNTKPTGELTSENIYFDNSEMDGGSVLGVRHGTGLTPAQMKKQSSFKGFDFNSIWEIKEGQSTPTLRWEKDTATGKYVLKIKIGNAEVVYGDDRLGSSLTYPAYFTPSDGLSLFNYGYTYEGLQDNDDIKQVLANNGHLIFIGEWTTAKNVKKSGDNIVGYTVDIERPTIAKQFADKYDIQWETGTLTVTPKFVSVSGSKVYDGTSTVKLNKYRLEEKQLVNDDKNLTVSGVADIGIYAQPDPAKGFYPQSQVGNSYNNVPYAVKSPVSGGGLTVYNADGSINHNYMVDGVNSRWQIVANPNQPVNQTNIQYNQPITNYQPYIGYVSQVGNNELINIRNNEQNNKNENKVELDWGMCYPQSGMCYPQSYVTNNNNINETTLDDESLDWLDKTKETFSYLGDKAKEYSMTTWNGVVYVTDLATDMAPVVGFLKDAWNAETWYGSLGYVGLGIVDGALTVCDATGLGTAACLSAQTALRTKKIVKTADKADDVVDITKKLDKLEEKSKSVQRRKQLNEYNKPIGEKFEENVRNELYKKYGKDNVYEQVTIKQGDTKSRIDFLINTKQGWIGWEAKSSSTAPATKNQNKIYGNINSGNTKVELRTDKMEGYSKGDDIEINEIRKVIPKK